MPDPASKDLFLRVLAAYCLQRRLAVPVPEHRFHPDRMWRFDFAWPVQLVALEIEGGTRRAGGGRHNRAAGYADDCVKYTEAALHGWRVLRATWEQVSSGLVYGYIDRALTPSTPDATHPSART